MYAREANRQRTGALKGGFISPETALEWAEDIAPGCVSFIPQAITAEGAIA
jgi:hypothetical protein